MKKVVTPLGEAYQLSDNLVKSVTLLDKVNDLEVVKEHIRLLRAEYGEGLYYLSDTRLVKHANLEVRKYLAKHSRAKAAAILAINSTTIMFSNLFISFSRPPYPTKLFKEEADAIAWLVEQGAEAPKK
ncbi:STAS/SEC14 domain-containing protein [Saprospira grandis]|uniref:DUF7793 family protein n=1 Tax=Saprospira grandis TaxID=1008 RepID=UPI0022DD5A5A|nr:STAS/SEC14 domain-containing protein [Saprospira grandis]WBM75100.1 STAS/SEC14 domain-containing protein [Saprospira grandis]